MKELNQPTIEQMEKTAIKVSITSIVINVLLSLGKLIAGIVGHSGAMVSDAVHSASDVFSTFVVMIGVKMAAKESDSDHPYGHERLECVAAMILSMVLFITGLGIGYSGIRTIIAGDFSHLVVPGIMPLIAAVASIVLKEAMYWYTRVNAKKIDSSALMADAWHHRSDALSSIGALVGIAGARMGYPVLDPIASVVICLFIGKAAYDIFKDAVDKVVDHACDKETEEAILACVKKEEGVCGVDVLRTRIFGNRIYVDVEILAEGHMSLLEGHEIAERVHDRIESEFKEVKHIMIHVNPYEEK